MKKRLLLLVFSALAALLQAQTNLKASVPYGNALSYRTGSPYKNIVTLLNDKQADAQRTTNPDRYVANVCAAINSAAKNDFEKAKMAHDFVCLLASYDEAALTGPRPPQDWETVVRTKRCVCEGYANLYKKVCDGIRLPCDKVIGYARGVGTILATEPSPKESNHAWNILRIGGSIYLVDCTWDSGRMEVMHNRRDYSTDWLFLRPEIFIFTHFPEDSRCQLLETPVTAAEFSAQPDLRPKFFDTTAVRSKIVKKSTVAGTWRYTFTMKKGYDLTFNVVEAATGKTVENCTFVHRVAKGDSEALFSLPKAGLYNVTMFWWKTGDSTGRGCGEFLLESTKGSDVRFPQMFTSSARGVEIISPVMMPLERGKPYHFEVRVENKPIVTVKCGKTGVLLGKKSAGVFAGDIQIPASVSEVSILVADEQYGNYETIASYTVR